MAVFFKVPKWVPFGTQIGRPPRFWVMYQKVSLREFGYRKVTSRFWVPKSSRRVFGYTKVSRGDFGYQKVTKSKDLEASWEKQHFWNQESSNSKGNVEKTHPKSKKSRCARHQWPPSDISDYILEDSPRSGEIFLGRFFAAKRRFKKKYPNWKVKKNTDSEICETK